mgnify:FL=1
MSKYEVLWGYIKDNNEESYTLTFAEVEKLLGFKLDHSFLNYKKELLEYGYEIVKISLKNKTIFIRRIK